MKICYLNYYNPLTIHGGAEKVVLQEAKLVAQSGNDVVIITTHNAKGFRRVILDDGKIKVWFLPDPLPFSHRSSIYKSLALFLSIFNPLSATYVDLVLRIERPDILHIHNYGPLSPYVAKAAKRLGSKVIQTFHGYSFECPKGSLYRRTGTVCRNPLPICKIYGKIFRKKMSRYDSIISICSYVKERLVRAGISPNLISVIPNMNPRLHERTRNKTVIDRSRNKIILFVGRMVKAKGVHVLIKALAKIKKACNKEFIAIFIGDGEHKAYFETLARFLNINADFLGKVSEEILEEYYKEADLVVVPSLFPELFGLVILEAMSYGKPVIASRIGGIPELVLHEETGFLFEPNNVDALAKYIKILLTDDELAIDMGLRALKTSEKFSGTNHLKQLLNLYSKVLQQNELVK